MPTQVSTAVLAAHYAKLYTPAELKSRLVLSMKSISRQSAHNRKVGATVLGTSTLEALRAEHAALLSAVNQSKVSS